MMRKALVAGIVGFGLLAGCLATTSKYEDKLKTWVGESESVLVAKWGVPDSFYEAGSTKYLTYNYRNTGYVPPKTTNYGFGSAYSSTSRGYSYDNQCKTTFTIVASKVTSWRYKGNSCRSK